MNKTGLGTRIDSKLWRMCIRYAAASVLILGTAFTAGCATQLPDSYRMHVDRVAVDAPDTLKAGTAKVDITPRNPKGLIMGGFGWRKKALGVKHKMFARTLILQRGEYKVALVAVPMTGLMHDSVNEIKSRIPIERLNIKREHIIIASTHSHSAPDTVGFWGVPCDGKDKAYMKQLGEGIVQSIIDANANMVDAEIGHGTSVFDPEGFVSNKNIGNLIDPEVVSLHVREVGSKKPFATLFEFACHPEAARRYNQYLTPDFPHYAIQQVEAKFPGTTGIYVSGALGAMMSPEKELDEQTDTYPEMWKFVERIGNRLGDAAINATESITRFDNKPELGVWHRPLYLRNRNIQFTLLRSLGISKRPVYRPKGLWAYLTGKYFRYQYWGSEINMWKVNDFRLVSIPGELTPDLGLRLKDVSGGDTTMIVGLANDELGYLLPVTEAAMSQFDYERSLNISVLAGEHIRYLAETLGDLSTYEIP